MLKAIYNPKNIPYIFSGLEPVLKLKTKYIDNIHLEQPTMESETEPILLARFVHSNGTGLQTISYSTADIITKKGLKDVVPIILVLQDFNDRLYLALTYVKFWAPEPAIKPNQLELF